MTDVRNTPEYREGVTYAERNLNRLVEHFTSEELATDSLRKILFAEAMERYPTVRDDMDNDLRQSFFVAGAYRHLADELPPELRSAAAVFDTALEMSAIIGAEVGKKECLDALKLKPKRFWDRKLGAASPDDIVNVLSARWWREVGRPQGLERTTRWEVLIFATGAREMCALATVRRIKARVDGDYRSFVVVGHDEDFQVISHAVYANGRVIQWPGEIVG